MTIEGEFEKELQEETEADAVLTSELTHDVLTSESDHSLGGHPYLVSPRSMDISSYMEVFIQKNLGRSFSIQIKEPRV